MTYKNYSQNNEQELYDKFTNLGYNLIENRLENMIFVKG